MTNPVFQFVADILQRGKRTRQASLLWVLTVATDKQVSLTNALDALADESAGRWSFMVQDLAAMLKQGTPLQEAIAVLISIRECLRQVFDGHPQCPPPLA